MSGWFVFFAMGFYAACPAADNYRLGIPLFNKIYIKLNKDYYPGDQIIIEKKSLQSDKIFFNGKEINDYNINHRDMVKGGELIFDQ